MYFDLTSSNQTLDSTDIAGVQAIYGSRGTPPPLNLAAETLLANGSSGASNATNGTASAASHSAVDGQLDRLIASMASFNPQGAGDTGLQHEDDVHHHAMWAASTH